MPTIGPWSHGRGSGERQLWEGYLEASPMRHPLLYQINTRVVLGEIATRLGRPATLDDIPDALLGEIANRGFDWVWMLGVWQTGTAGRQVSLSQREAFRDALPDLTAADVSGSPFAIADYSVHRDFGGDRALA